MRGDSVRDLYAKGMALLGLGVLAGAGALVDYWPVQASLPAVSFANPLPSQPGPIAVQRALALKLTVNVAAPVAPLRAAVPAAPIEVAAADVSLAVVTVPADEPAPTITWAVVPVPDAEPAVLDTRTADYVPVAVSDAASLPAPVASLATSLSHNAPPPAAPSSNALQKAGGQILNVGFAMGTGVAKSFEAFGTAFGNIGRLFIK